MKTKILAIVEIAIVLCSMLLVALPAIAADQNQEMQKASTTEITTASEDDFVLEIYGNANEDDVIDMRDYTHTARIICWLEEETTFADANYDGRISVADMTQIGLIILGRESELTIVDSMDRIVTVSKPVERIILVSASPTAAVVKALGAEDKVIAVTEGIKKKTTFFPEMSKLPSVGLGHDSPDYEMIIALEPDVVIHGWMYDPEEVEEMLEPAGITVVCLYCAPPLTYTEDVKKLGYILGKKDRADEYIDWYQSSLDTIAERVEGLSEGDKPRVFDYYGGEWGMCEGPPYGTFGKDNFYADLLIEMAGGINIAGDLPGDWITVEPEWVTYENPSIIIREVYVEISGPIMGYDVDDTSEAAAFREDIMSQDAFMPTDAVKDEEVYPCLGEIMGGYWFVGIQYMAKWFHPELFEDLDPQAVHQEFLTEFQRLDYDLNEHGVFVYHPEKHPAGK